MILVLAGTSDSKNIIKELLNLNKKVIATTTTAYGNEILPNHYLLEKFSKDVHQKNLIEIIKKYNIRCIIDSTHPYAYNISKKAMFLSKKYNLKYFRYERKNILFKHKNLLRFDTYDSILKNLKNKSGNVLLTIGSKNIDKFSDIEKSRVFIRILPTSKSLKICEELGYLPKQILAIQGPFSRQLNLTMYKDFKIKYIVTKESSKAGGFENKVIPALENNINVLTIKRKKIPYFNKFYSVDDLLNALDFN